MSDPQHLSAGADQHGESHAAKHATAGTYVAVLGALAVLTLIELVVAYIPIVREPLLIIIAIGKAWLVLQFYMHLRYENKILTWIFMIPAVAVGIVTVIMQFFV
ncbi:MAG: cytochrome C oxidase subunit IV [Chloroflexi bacterium CFX4]|nr:cytochrome C oxidase subunit IV [Chloroflexi bacterium CFX4]MDL1923869.1 cytochrome C oxidase subunit IV [Chloroflexi bacterium CFX3]